MIPILYSPGETEFTSNGVGRLSEAISCIVEEERNGPYELTLQYPISGKYFDRLAPDMIIAVIHDDNHDLQPFDIYKISKPIDGVVTVNARHVSYRLSSYTVMPITAGTCATALLAISSNIVPYDCPFTFWTDKDVAANFKVNQPQTVRSTLGGQVGSILDVFGKADYEWDKWTVKLHAHRGTRSGQVIRYGHNLSDITHVVDTSGVYNAFAPYWRNEETGETIVLPEAYVEKPEVNIVTGILHVNGAPLAVNDHQLQVTTIKTARVIPLDLSGEFGEEVPTEEQLRNKAVSLLESRRGWIPNENIKINFVQLWQTDEYKDVAALQRLSLCDEVDVYHKGIGVYSRNVQIIKVRYDVLLERYESMELGEPKTSLGDAIKSDTVSEVLTVVPTKSMLQKAIDAATQLITGGYGGHVVIGTNANGEPNEILIMDTASMETAVNVLRINMNGIGFSNSGYEGPFRSAWTLDGHFVADFIDTGTLSANLLKAGIISSVDGNNWWNLETGELHMIASSFLVNGGQETLDNALSILETKAGDAEDAADEAIGAAADAQDAADEANRTAGDALAAARAAETNAKALVVTLSRDSFVIPTDDDGDGGDYTGCSTVVGVQWGNTDVTADADITITDGTGILLVNGKQLIVNAKPLKVCAGDITSSWDPDTHTYTVTESRADIAIVTFTVTYAGKTITKQLNIVKAMQGMQGVPGQDGQDGAAGVSVISVDVWYAISTSSTIAPTTGWSTDQPQWEDGKYIWFKTITAYSTGTTSESEPACITGSAGYPGETGVGIDSIEEQYYLNTSDTETPDPDSPGWSTTPTWESGKYLWSRLKITYDDEQATVKYTDPVLAQAINDANQRAEDVQTELNNMELGGVNLIRVANTLLFDNYYFYANLLVNGTQLATYNGGTRKNLWSRVAP